MIPACVLRIKSNHIKTKNNMKKILLICTQSNQICGFRKSLIETLQANDFCVSAIAFDDRERLQIEKMGVNFFCINGANRSLNPFKMLSLKKKYLGVIRQVEPDIVFTFMLKPNVFGVKAAKKAGVKNIYSMVEGAGDVFINVGLEWNLIRWVVCKLYRGSFKKVKRVFFLNEDDKKEFINRKLLKVNQCEVIHGIGVDLEKFQVVPINNAKTFLMIARMLNTKGVFEYCQAAKIVKQKYPDAMFNYLGREGTIKIIDIEGYIKGGIINYWGETKDVRPYIAECSVNVLPSYREGFGLVNAEAGAMGRISITCDTNGTRDTIKDGYSGFLIPVRDVDSLVEKMIWCIEHPEDVISMGKNARCYCEENFDVNMINKKIIQVIEENFIKESTHA